MHSSVGNIGLSQLQSTQGMNTGPTTALYKTNTLDQYGGVGGGRNSALGHDGSNHHAIINSSVIGPASSNQQQQMLGISHHQRNNTTN